MLCRYCFHIGGRIVCCRELNDDLKQWPECIESFTVFSCEYKENDTEAYRSLSRNLGEKKNVKTIKNISNGTSIQSSSDSENTKK